jgi:hypothetical protein
VPACEIILTFRQIDLADVQISRVLEAASWRVGWRRGVSKASLGLTPLDHQGT